MILATVAVGVAAWVSYRTSSEVSRDPQVVDPAGEVKGRALIVFHPGLSDFPDSVTTAFARGLSSQGWQVELATASARAPSQVDRYDLLAVASPVYWWAPARPLRRYLERLEDLEGKPTVVLLTGSGSAARALRLTEQLVQRANGHVVNAMAFYTWRPNDEAQHGKRSNRAIAREQAYQAGRRIAAPSSAAK